MCVMTAAAAYPVLAQSYADSLQQILSNVAELEATVKELKSGQPVLNWQDYLGIGIVVAALVSLIGFYFKKSVEASKDAAISKLEAELATFQSRAKDNIQLTESEIIAAINGNRRIFDQLREAVDLEAALMKTKRIRVVGELPDSVLQILTQVQFPRKNLITDSDEDANGPFDLYFINNENGTQNLDEFVEQVKALPNQVHVFYYSTKHGTFFPTGKLPYADRHRVNFATNPAQMYGNLINSLKYQHRSSKQ